MPMAAPVRRLPLHVADGRLLGGLDLAATLRAGRPVAERGLLAEADGGVVLVAMAERLTPGTAARLAAALDAGEVLLERDGLALRTPARFGVVALDEGTAEDERPPAALLDRLAFQLDLAGIGVRGHRCAGRTTRARSPRRGRGWPSVEAGAEIVEALCAAAMALGIGSIRAPLLALRVARAAAALAGRSEVARGATPPWPAGWCWRRARRALPATEPPAARGGRPAAADRPATRRRPAARTTRRSRRRDRAAAGAIWCWPRPRPRSRPTSWRSCGSPAVARGARSRRARRCARSTSGARGRPTGVRRGEPRAGARLNVVETLRAAAPWQPLRRRERGAGRGRGSRSGATISGSRGSSSAPGPRPSSSSTPRARRP